MVVNKSEGLRVSMARTGETEVGVVWLAVSEKGVVALEIGGSEADFRQLQQGRSQEVVGDFVLQAQEAAAQVEAYLAGRRRQFELEVDWSAMSEFQAAVLKIVCAIPYGETRSYGQVALEIGRPGAGRAVGRANATNPIPLLIPCHRVIAADGSLRGYGGGEGLKTKAWLLALERPGSQVVG
jgi:methylated-DNA-[protein]-cysteine S-methyltransferase